jgi:hypothetical protein
MYTVMNVIAVSPKKLLPMRGTMTSSHQGPGPTGEQLVKIVGLSLLVPFCPTIKVRAERLESQDPLEQSGCATILELRDEYGMPLLVQKMFRRNSMIGEQIRDPRKQ